MRPCKFIHLFSLSVLSLVLLGAGFPVKDGNFQGTNQTFDSTANAMNFMDALESKSTNDWVRANTFNATNAYFQTNFPSISQWQSSNATLQAQVGGSASIPTIWTNQANLKQSITFSTNITWNVANGQYAIIVCTNNTSTNFTIKAPTNLTNGSYYLQIIQSSTGNATGIWNSVFKWRGGITNNLSTNASAVDGFSWISDGTNMWPGGLDMR